MKLLDWYIGRAVAVGTLSVFVVMLSLFGLILFAGQTDDIGRADYTAAVAFEYVVLSLPQQLYQMFPLIALLGAILGLGVLASNNELLIMRAAGISVTRIAVAVLKTGLILALFAIVIGEFVAPPAIEKAKTKRLQAMDKKISLNTDYGLWALDGKTYIHIERTGEGKNHDELSGVNLYIYDGRILKEKISAKNAVHKDDAWILEKVEILHISQDGIYIEKKDRYLWHSPLNPEVINVVSLPPQSLSLRKLYRIMDHYARTNPDQDLRQYKLSFYSKLIMPLTIFAMIVLAMPFIFGSLRNVSVGQRIFIGFMLGLIFYLFNTFISKVGIVHEFIPPLLAAGLPTVFVLSVGVFLLRKVR